MHCTYQNQKIIKTIALGLEVAEIATRKENQCLASTFSNAFSEGWSHCPVSKKDFFCVQSNNNSRLKHFNGICDKSRAQEKVWLPMFFKNMNECKTKNQCLPEWWVFSAKAAIEEWGWERELKILEFAHAFLVVVHLLGKVLRVLLQGAQVDVVDLHLTVALSCWKGSSSNIYSDTHFLNIQKVESLIWKKRWKNWHPLNWWN